MYCRAQCLPFDIWAFNTPIGLYFQVFLCGGDLTSNETGEGKGGGKWNMKNIQVIKLAQIILKKSGAQRLPESVDMVHSKGKVWPEVPAEKKVNCLHVFTVKELGEFTQEYFHMESSTENLFKTEVLLGEIKVQMKWAVTSCQDQTLPPTGSKGAQGWISWATSWDGNLSLGTHGKCDNSSWNEFQGRCGKLQPGEHSACT